MKKGDVIQKRDNIHEGKSLMHGFETLVKAEEAQKHVYEYYKLPESAMTRVGDDPLNIGKFAVIAYNDTYVTIDAKVNWVVDTEVGITYVDGGSAVIDLDDEEHNGWVVISSVAPTYQSNVEHMSDDELRASIEGLRSTRVAKPAKIKRVTTVKAPPMSAEDKKLSGVLGALSPEAKLALQRKLGLID